MARDSLAHSVATHQSQMSSSDAVALEILGPATPRSHEVLTREALDFVAALHREFDGRRRELLHARVTRQAAIEDGAMPGFPSETADVRAGDWRVAATPADLNDRRVEITGPVERKMMINALNSGASVFMADFEDATSPTWENIVEGQANCMDAVRRTLGFVSPEGKQYRLAEKTATLVVRPRGWHLSEAHAVVEGQPVSASLWDFGLYVFHNARELLARGSGPYFYLPKLESHLEARLWNDVFVRAQALIGIPRGTIRATVLIETVLAALEMDEILYELREHAAGLNAGRWDYIFSIIKKFRHAHDFVMPDRAKVTMAVPFMRAYAQLLVRTCHRRGAHAIGGMAAFIPSRKDPEVNENALAKVREDKQRESGDGFDGTWVAHPDLVPVAREIFDGVLGARPHQKDRLREDVRVEAQDILRVHVPGATVTSAGVRLNIDVALQYLEAWLRGTGAVAIHNLMEDAATAEISRAQLWQWIHHGVSMSDGGIVSPAFYRKMRAEVLESLIRARDPAESRLGDAADLLDALVLGKDFAEFLTLSAYRELIAGSFRGRVSSVSSDRAQSVRGNGAEEPAADFQSQVDALTREWTSDARWRGITRDYSAADVVRLRGSLRIEHSLARMGSERLWQLLSAGGYVHTFGALTGAQAVQMVRAGLQAIYLSGWQVAADGNLASQTYPDQSLYPSNSVPALVRRLNNALVRADQIEWSESVAREGGARATYWLAPIVADAEAGFGGPLHAFELTKAMIEAGASGVHFEDQLASEKKCGHMGGKVLVPTSQFLRTLAGARLAADVLGVSTVLIARTDAHSASLITSDVDARDRPFMSGGRTAEGFFRVRAGLEAAIARGLAYAPYADLVWCETSTPDLAEAKEFAEGIHAQFPGKKLAYNCSPSFNWQKKLDAETIARFQRELGAMGYAFQFITLAGWHLINLNSYELATAYRDEGMPAYVRVQAREFERESTGYTATKHQREAGTGYFDQVLEVITQGQASTGALEGSTEASQFHGV